MGGVECAKHNMCGHRHRQVRQRHKRSKVGSFQLVLRRIDPRQSEMAVCRGTAVPGNVLEDREDAALLQPLGDRPRDRRDLGRLGSIGAVADHAPELSGMALERALRALGSRKRPAPFDRMAARAELDALVERAGIA